MPPEFVRKDTGESGTWRDHRNCADIDPKVMTPPERPRFITFTPKGNRAKDEVRFLHVALTNRERLETFVHEAAIARKICQGCVVKDQCLEAAIVMREKAGTWGGLTAKERRSLTRAGRGWEWSEVDRYRRTKPGFTADYLVARVPDFFGTDPTQPVATPALYQKWEEIGRVLGGVEMLPSANGAPVTLHRQSA